jgi:hypothetical protein
MGGMEGKTILRNVLWLGLAVALCVIRLQAQAQEGKSPDQIVGGPEWINTVRWDITAKAQEDAPPQQTLVMPRTLLADRFKLASAMKHGRCRSTR